MVLSFGSQFKGKARIVGVVIVLLFAREVTLLQSCRLPVAVRAYCLHRIPAGELLLRDIENLEKPLRKRRIVWFQMRIPWDQRHHVEVSCHPPRVLVV